MDIIARVPADPRGYNPIEPAYGDHRIVGGPVSNSATFGSLDAAITAAREFSNTYDDASAVFQAANGAYQLGFAYWEGDGNGSEYLALPEAVRGALVFESPQLMAIVSNDRVFTRPA